MPTSREESTCNKTAYHVESRKSLPKTKMDGRYPHQVVRFHSRIGFISHERELLDIVLRFSAAQASYIQERVWHLSQQLEAQADGSLILRFRASGRFEIVRWILGWGEEVEVVEPLDLRQEVALCLQEAARQY